MLLHVQSRTYPTYHLGLRGVATPTRLSIGDLEASFEPHEMCSLAYGHEPLVVADLSEVLARVDTGPPIRWARLTVLRSAAVVLSVASDGTCFDGLDLLEACDLDAAIADRRRAGMRDALIETFDALLASELLDSPVPRLGWHPGLGSAAVVDSRGARYSCHFVSERPRWEPDPRVQSTTNGGAGRVLLPYTYRWDRPADLDPAELLGELEPADLVAVQRSVLGVAALEALEMLEGLSGAAPAAVPVGDLRCHLDRVRVAYHQLDEYRYDSTQRARGLYLVGRHEVGLEEIHRRTEAVLAQAAESLEAASTARTIELDSRLNRLAALFTIVASGAFALQVLEFLAGGPPDHRWQRGVALLAIVLLSAAVPLAFVLRRRRREAPRSFGRLEGPQRGLGTAPPGP